MPIMLNGHKGIAYTGDYATAELGIGNQLAAGWKLSTKPGTSLSFADTYKTPVDALTVFGKSTQVQSVQGKNIVPSDLTKWERGYWSGTNFSKAALPAFMAVEQEYNRVKLQVLQSGFALGIISPAVRVPTGATNVIASRNIISIQGSCFAHYGFYSENQTLLGHNYTGQVVAGAVFVTVMWRTSGAVGDFFEINNVQLESGTVATAFTPFVPNSPSPDYPSPITNIGDSGGVTVGARGKNLIDLTTFNAGAPYNTVTVQNGRLRYEGKYNFYFVFQNPLPPGTYRLTADSEFFSGQTVTAWRFTYSDSTTSNYGYFTTAITATKPISRVQIYPNFGEVTTIADFWNIQLELGSTATGYQPYYTPSTIEQSIILRSLPDGTKDEWNTVTGGVTRRVGVKVLDASDITSTYPTYSYVNIVYASILKPADYIGYNKVTQNDYMFTHAKSHIATSGWDDASKVGFVFTGAHSLRLWIGFPAGTTLAQMQAALTGAVLLYKLATPTTEQLTPGTLYTTPRHCNISAGGADLTATVKTAL